MVAGERQTLRIGGTRISVLDEARAKKTGKGCFLVIIGVIVLGVIAGVFCSDDRYEKLGEFEAEMDEYLTNCILKEVARGRLSESDYGLFRAIIDEEITGDANQQRIFSECVMLGYGGWPVWEE